MVVVGAAEATPGAKPMVNSEPTTAVATRTTRIARQYVPNAVRHGLLTACHVTIELRWGCGTLLETNLFRGLYSEGSVP
ncbi:hypothetical protein MDOR_17660 [Mycolicibacterium doricum]|uniref:Uncharacterized protein n=1 Tax=Mycolicibacterium doricum TaxID=126673 RepID=A0A7I7VRV0_9MYCO|nr:hypothetical protein MDOR_17660 [Mycolicibacterium doricum]